MTEHLVVSRAEWLEARKQLLAEEKEFTQQRDALSARRRALPWVAVEKAYRFEGPEGPASLGDLFDGKSQLVVYHFMFGPDWEKPCKSCSFWADGYNGMGAHLAARDTRLVAISRAPLAKLQDRAKRMGWTFPWYSSGEDDFNYDFGVSFRPEELSALILRSLIADAEAATGKKVSEAVISVPAYQWLFGHHDVQLGHYRRYTRRSLLAVLREHFEIERSRYYGASLIPIALWFSKLSKQPYPVAAASGGLMHAAMRALCSLESRIALPMGTSVLVRVRRRC